MAGAQKWKDQRSLRVKRLADSLHEALIAPDGGQRVSLTGSLVRWTNLRSHESKKTFQIIVQASLGEIQENDKNRERRFWTKRTVEEAIRVLVKRDKICPPTGPGFEWNEWFKAQSELIHDLCQRASRNRLGMDELQTVPFDPEERCECSMFESQT